MNNIMTCQYNKYEFRNTVRNVSVEFTTSDASDYSCINLKKPHLITSNYNSAPTTSKLEYIYYIYMNEIY